MGQLHIYQNINGQNGQEYLHFDAKNFFLSKKFAQFPEDYSYSVGITSLSISFFKEPGDTLLDNLINTKSQKVRIFLDTNFVFNAVLELVDVNLINMDSSGNFHTIIKAKLNEDSTLYQFLGAQAGTYGYTFSTIKGTAISLNSYLSTFFGYIGFTVTPFNPDYTIIPTIDSSSISWEIAEANWTGKFKTISGQSTVIKKPGYTIWPLQVSESPFINDSNNDYGQKFYWKTGEWDENVNDNPDYISYAMTAPCECLYQRLGSSYWFLNQWYPQYSMAYFLIINKSDSFSLSDTSSAQYILGCSNITNINTHFWTKNEYLGEYGTMGINFSDVDSIAMQIPGNLYAAADLDPVGVTGPVFNGLIFWVAAHNWQTGTNSITTHEPERPSGTASFIIRRRKQTFTSTIWINKMADTQNKDIFQVFCRNIAKQMVIDTNTKTVLFNNNDSPLNCSFFAEPITFEWKVATVKFDVTKDPCYIKEKFSPDPKDLIKEYDYKYYSITFKTILSWNDFSRVKNNHSLHISFGNYTNNNLIITDIKNWNPESGLCTISAYDHTIHQKIWKSNSI